MEEKYCKYIVHLVGIHNKTSCDLHSVSYLNLSPPSLCLSSSKELNLSNGNQLDVTKSLSPDWQENSHE